MTYKKNMAMLHSLLGIGENKVNTYQLIKNAIKDNDTTVEEVITHMMSPEDFEDLKTGLIPQESLECHIKVWCEMGKPNQNLTIGEN